MSPEEHEDPGAAATADAEAAYYKAWRERIGEIVTVRLEQRLAEAPDDRYVELRPATKYERVRPRLVNPELAIGIVKARYLYSFVAETRPEGVATLHDITLSWGSTIEFSDGRLLHEASTQGRFHPIRGEHPRRHWDRAILGCRRAHRNYGHFLIEVLPHLVLNREALPDDVPILLHVGSHKFARPMLRMAGIAPRNVKWIGRGPFKIDEAYWSTPMTTGLNTTSPNVTTFLQSLVDKLPERRDAPDRSSRFGRRRRKGTRLYVGRGDASNRHLTNEDELMAKLEPRGFERVLAGTMTFEEQVRAFSQAEVVIGVCGASMTNLVFMPPGSAVVMLTPETMAGYYFWDLASHLGLDYTVLWGPTGPPEEYDAGGARRHQGKPDVDIRSDFRVDVGLVVRTLKDAGLW